MITDKRIKKAVKLQETGNTEEAEILYHKILKSNPDDFVSMYSLGVIAFIKNDYGSALDLFEKAKVINNKFAPLWYNAGLTLGRLARYDEALQNLEQALSLDPGYEDAKNHRESLRLSLSSVSTNGSIGSYTEKLGKAFELQAQQKMDEAETIFMEILASNPSDIPSLYSLGVIEQHRGQSEKALAYFHHGLVAKPDYDALWYNCGVVHQSLKQHDKAIESYDKALALNPKYKEALNNKGTVLVDLKRHKDALLTYEELLKIDSQDDKALNNRGTILTDFKLYDVAIQTFECLLRVSPDYDYALGQLAFAKMHACDWKGLAEVNSKIIDAVRAGKRACKTQPLLAITGDPADHLKCARIFSQQHCPPQEPVWRGEIYNHDKIRIAYISPDFREHPVGHLTAGIFENHDKQRFEITAISLGINDDSTLRHRMEAAFDHFIDVRQMVSRDVAAMIRNSEIDIVVDLAGYTADSRSDILSYRPAPIQVNFLGYSSTMGAEFVNYIIADRHIIPEEYRDCYSEKVVHLPDTYMPTDSTVSIAATTPPREEYGLPKTGFVFCSFNHDYKISPDIFDIWMRLLIQIPGSVLWLMKLNESAERNLRSEAAERGIEPERIIFATRVPKIEDHLARYRMADLFLDTTPYNAHTTTSDVLRAGLPVLTCRGKSFASRVAAGLLNIVGLPELVTDSLEDYEALALRLANDCSMLQGIREKLQRNLETTPLYDTARYCRNLEQAYIKMWERCRRGEVPEHFSVEDGESIEVEIPIKQGKQQTISILVPIYKSTLDESEQFAIDMLARNAPNRNKVFVAPRGLNISYYQERYPDFQFELFEDAFFSSIKTYNHLLLSNKFYERFNSYDYILIHQTDAILLKDDLDYWMERGFDYIGAPWPSGVEVRMLLGKFSVGDGLNLKAYVGNGGFSLRSVKGSIAVLQEFDDIRTHWINSTSSEDLFFAYMGMVSDKFTIPNQMLASRFSLESEPEKYFMMNGNIKPTGCHAGWKVYKEFWEKIINNNGVVG